MKKRYRLEERLLRKPLVVLQVGIESKRGTYYSFDGDVCAPPNWDSEELITTWRDATAEDLMNLKEEEE